MIVVPSEPFNDAVPLILAALGELKSSAPSRVCTYRFLLAASSLIGHEFLKAVPSENSIIFDL